MLAQVKFPTKEQFTRCSIVTLLLFLRMIAFSMRN